MNQLFILFSNYCWMSSQHAEQGELEYFKQSVHYIDATEANQ